MLSKYDGELKSTCYITMENPMRPLFLLLSTLLICSTSVASEEWEIMTENYPPFNYVRDGKAVGAITNVVQEIQKRIGDKTPIQLYSWNKAYEIISTKPNKILFSMAKTAIRTPSFKWVGPVLLIKGFFYQHKDAKRSPESMDDIKNNFIVGVRENSNIHLNFIREGFKHIVPLENTEAYYRGLYFNRVDLIIASPYNIPVRAKRYNLDATAFQKSKVPTNTGRLYIAFSKDTPESVIGQWQNELDEIRNEGLLEKLVQEGMANTEKDFDIKYNFDEF